MILDIKMYLGAFSYLQKKPSTLAFSLYALVITFGFSQLTLVTARRTLHASPACIRKHQSKHVQTSPLSVYCNASAELKEKECG